MILNQKNDSGGLRILIPQTMQYHQAGQWCLFWVQGWISGRADCARPAKWRLRLVPPPDLGREEGPNLWEYCQCSLAYSNQTCLPRILAEGVPRLAEYGAGSDSTKIQMRGGSRDLFRGAGWNQDHNGALHIPIYGRAGRSLRYLTRLVPEYLASLVCSGVQEPQLLLLWLDW